MTTPNDLQRLARTLAGATLLTLTACGGGSDTTAAGPGAPVPVAAVVQPSALGGTAATGTALGNANVAITDSSGTSPCVETTITTTALGSYSCTLVAGKSAPFFVVVTDPAGNTPAMVSVQTTTPAAGQSLTVNVTPLTTAIVAQLSADGNALSVVASKSVDAAALKQVTANVVAQLASVLNAIGVPANYDPFSTAITAATSGSAGNTADLVLDVVRITRDPVTGQAALSTISNPTPIVMASATTVGTLIAAPSAGVSALSQATQLMARDFTACFAVPLAQRVLTKDTTIVASAGGPQVESVATACQTLTWFQENNDQTKPNFLHNGYSDGQFLYNVLTSDTMTGAQFSVPEIMAFYPADTTVTHDTALLNIKYLDSAGNPGNLVTVAHDYAGTSSTSRPTTWWLAGNQNSVDVSTRLTIRRTDQLNASNTNNPSTFQTGVQFRINYTGPGSLRGGLPLKYARVTGPGLPTNGLVYGRSTIQYTTNMDLVNKLGTIPSPVTDQYGCNGAGLTYDCPNFWLARTAGTTGSAATTLKTNPAGVAGWAETTDGSDVTKFAKGQKYKVELFYGTNTGTADVTLTKTLSSDLVEATAAVNLPWNAIGTATTDALNPTGTAAGAQANTLLIDWIQNLAAQQIGSVQAVIDGKGSYGASISVAKGATSVVLSNVTVPAFSLTTPPSRLLLLSYRMLDTSSKTAVSRYN